MPTIQMPVINSPITRRQASSTSSVPKVDEKVDRAALDGANEALPKVDLTPAVKQLVLEFLNVLINDYGCDDKNSMLTDRTFSRPGRPEIPISTGNVIWRSTSSSGTIRTD